MWCKRGHVSPRILGEQNPFPFQPLFCEIRRRANAWVPWTVQVKKVMKRVDDLEKQNRELLKKIEDHKVMSTTPSEVDRVVPRVQYVNL